jgi:hypothetical protein
MFIVFVPFALLTAEPKLGRYADGTPYRIDADGNEIVDQLAQLEVEKRDAEFRIQALERDLEVKELALAEVQDNEELSSSDTTRKDNVTSARVTSARPSGTPPEPHLYKDDRQGQLSQKELSQLRLDLAKSESMRKELLKTMAELKKEKQQYQKLLNTNNRAISNLRDSRDVEQQKLKDQLEERNKEQARVALLEDKLKKEQLKNATLAKKIGELNKPKEEVIGSFNLDLGNNARARYDTAVHQQPKRSYPSYTAPIENVDRSLLSQAKRYVTEIEGAIAVRDRLFKEYNDKKNRVVSFTPRGLQLSNGESYALLKRRLHRVNTTRELTQIMRGLRAIQTLLNDDIALVRRLM